MVAKRHHCPPVVSWCIGGVFLSATEFSILGVYKVRSTRGLRRCRAGSIVLFTLRLYFSCPQPLQS